MFYSQPATIKLVPGKNFTFVHLVLTIVFSSVTNQGIEINGATALRRSQI